MQRAADPVEILVTSDWSSPRSERTVAMLSGVARKPSIERTGSPGTSRISANTKMLIANSVGIAESRRISAARQRGLTRPR